MDSQPGQPPTPPIVFLGKYQLSIALSGAGTNYISNNGSQFTLTRQSQDASNLVLYSLNNGASPTQYVLQLADTVVQKDLGAPAFLCLSGITMPNSNGEFPGVTASTLDAATPLLLNKALSYGVAELLVPAAGGAHFVANAADGPAQFWIPAKGSIFDNGSWTLTTITAPGSQAPYADYRCVQFASASVNGTFTNADFEYASFNGAWAALLADFSGASFQYADLSGCLFSIPSLSWAATLTGASFSLASLDGADFTGIDLTGISFYAASIGAAIFAGCPLTGASFAYCTIGAANFAPNDSQPCALAGASFANATIGAPDFTSSDLTGASFANCPSIGAAIFTGCTLIGADFSNDNVSSATFDTPATLAPASVTTGPTPSNPLTSFNGATLNVAILGLNWTWVDLTGATILGSLPQDLSGMTALYTKFPVGYSLAGAQLDNADFSYATMNGVVLTNTEVISAPATFIWADLTNAQLGSANLPKSAFDNVTFHCTKGDGATFDGGSMTGAQFDANSYFGTASLQGVDLSGANLTGANFSSANFATATFSLTVISGTYFSGAYLTALDFTDVKDNTMAGSHFDNACLLNAKMNGTNLDGVDFTNAVLQGASFTDATLVQSAKLDSAGIALTSGKISVTPPGSLAPERLAYGVTDIATSATDSTTICPNTIPGPCSGDMWTSATAPTKWPSSDGLALSEGTKERGKKP